jgi:MoaA/NifB/PqqE/SkfB family radical SAM enzyme
MQRDDLQNRSSDADCSTETLTAEIGKVDIIWNTTLICMWDCAVCCVDAVHVANPGGKVVMRSHGLQHVEELPRAARAADGYEAALRARQARGLELTLGQKLQVLEHLRGCNAKVDISGGDPLAIDETWEVMRRASEMLGRDRVTLTATGAGMGRYNVDALVDVIGELNFTYDSSSRHISRHRPGGYASGNLKKAARFAAAGGRTRGETPLTTRNIDDGTLTAIFLDLHEAGIARHLLMRLFPVGRGALLAADIPSRDQYRRAIDLLRELERRYGHPKVKLQCALKFLDDAANRLEDNPCDLVRESFGLMADGTLLASPWAIGPTGQPLDELWVLGNLATTPLPQILAGERTQRFLRRMNDNFGHCKIHAFLASRHPDKQERLFAPADPLYDEASGDRARGAAVRSSRLSIL